MAITVTRYENYAVTRLQYNDLSLTHRFVPLNSKNLPNFNIETIDVVGEKLYYQLVYGGHRGEQDVTIEIKDFSEEKGKIERKKVEQHFCEVLSKMKFNIRLSAKEAVAIAKKDMGGFLGTWTETSLKKGNWHIKSSSKSANPPNYYIIDAQYGEILLKLDNTDDPDQKKNLEENKIRLLEEEAERRRAWTSGSCLPPTENAEKK